VKYKSTAYRHSEACNSFGLESRAWSQGQICLHIKKDLDTSKAHAKYENPMFNCSKVMANHTNILYLDL